MRNKVMEAPEKIYLIRNFTTSTSLNTANDHRGKYLQEWYKSREKYADVEYTRTDAFIDKAFEWLKSNLYNYAGEDGKKNIVPFNDSVFEDFRKYMEE